MLARQVSENPALVSGWGGGIIMCCTGWGGSVFSVAAVRDC